MQTTPAPHRSPSAATLRNSLDDQQKHAPPRPRLLLWPAERECAGDRDRRRPLPTDRRRQSSAAASYLWAQQVSGGPALPLGTRTQGAGRITWALRRPVRLPRISGSGRRAQRVLPLRGDIEDAHLAASAVPAATALLVASALWGCTPARRSTACTSHPSRADIPACAAPAFNTRGEAPKTRRAQPDK